MTRSTARAPGAPAPVRKQDPDHLVWMDLEMTGLDAQRDAILQAALIITNARLDVLEEFVCDVWQPDSELEKMSPFVRDMHEKTGLLTRVKASRIDAHRAQQHLLEIVCGWCPYGSVLCGNSIWQDRKFIDRHFPGLAAYLTYRMIDVSSVKLLARTWYGASAVFTKPSIGEHDALVDIRNSILELKHYKDTLWRNA
jgi:oligoribonuclease